MVNMNIASSDFCIATTLELPENEVHLWRIDLDAMCSDEARWQKLLSVDEAAHASRFRFAVDRQRYTISRGSLRTILAAYLATDAKGLCFSYSSKEKPSLSAAHSEKGVTFNISHSGSVVLLAFSRRREIGVDVEQVRVDFEVEAIAQRFSQPTNNNNLRLYPKTRDLKPSSVVGLERRPTSKQPGTVCPCPCINSTSRLRREIPTR